MHIEPRILKTSKASLFSLGIALFLAVTLSSSGQAVIDWDTVQDLDEPGDIYTAHPLVVAEAAFTSDITVNGITFAAADTVNDITFSGVLDTDANFVNEDRGFDADYNRLVNRGFHTSDGGTGTITLSGLTDGQRYRVQIIVGYWNNPFPTSFISGSTVDMGNGAGTPKWVTGTFDASGTTQVITFQATTFDGSDDFGIGSAVALYAVPEPANFAVLGGLAALGFAVSRRRRRSCLG